MAKLTLEMCEAHAKALGLIIEEDHLPVLEDLIGEKLDLGYWIIDPATGEGPLPDDNFSTTLIEVAGKLCFIEYERTYGTGGV